VIGSLVRLGVHLGAVAVGLLIAAVALDRFGLTFTGFVIAVVLFAILQLVLGWLVEQVTSRKAPELTRIGGLLTTFAALLVTTLLTDGLAIDGVTAWIVGPLIVWGAMLLASVALPLGLRQTGLRRHLEKRTSS
jgi:predicted membrane-bound spermidine synthase